MGLFDDVPMVGQGASGSQPEPSSPASRSGLFDDVPMLAKPEKANPGWGDTAVDVAKSAGSGLASGVAGLVGLPGTLKTWVADPLADLAVGAIRGRPVSAEEKVTADSAGRLNMVPDAGRVLTPERVAKAIEGVTGPAHQPETVAGEYAKTLGEFAPSMVFGGGTIPQRIAQVVIPALASETAGQFTKGTAHEPVARIAGALAGGVGTAVGQARTGARAMVSEALEGVTPQEMAAARQLITDGAALPGGGVTLTLDEALNQVTGGRAQRLSQLNRVVTNSGGEGGRAMAETYAARPGQVDATGRAAIDTIGPASAAPSTIGPAASRTAEAIVQDGTNIINRGTRQFYVASDAARVGPQVHAGLMSEPIYAQTLQEIRDTPALNHTIAHLPDDSGAVIDLVQRRLREVADNTRMPGQTSTSNLAAANLDDVRRAPVAALETATGSRPATATQPAVAGDYEAARTMQAKARERFLQPLLDGPIGQLAARDPTTEQAIATLFPKNPLPNSAGEVGSAVHALAGRNERVARDLVRAHIESAFNGATADLQSGANVMGGARFARDLTGNPQAAANVESAIRALPHGDAVADGFNRFLEVMRATGQKPAKGSDTAFNQAIQEGMKNGVGPVGAVIEQTSKAGLGLKQFVSDKWAAYRTGQNTSELAYMLTDPQAVPLLRQLSRETVGSGRADYLTARLTAMGERAYNGRRQPPAQ